RKRRSCDCTRPSTSHPSQTCRHGGGLTNRMPRSARLRTWSVTGMVVVHGRKTQRAAGKDRTATRNPPVGDRAMTLALATTHLASLTPHPPVFLASSTADITAGFKPLVADTITVMQILLPLIAVFRIVY